MRIAGRPQVACINWNGDAWAPRAAVLVETSEGVVRDAFFDTWTEAIEWANRYARLYVKAMHKQVTP